MFDTPDVNCETGFYFADGKISLGNFDLIFFFFFLQSKILAYKSLDTYQESKYLQVCTIKNKYEKQTGVERKGA